jgi:hypothetical protein
MADPRLSVNFDGIKPVKVTFKHDSSIVYLATEENGSVSVGLAVTLTSTAKTVSLVADGEGVKGKLIQVFSDGFCSVQVNGFMQLPGGTAATLTHGKKIVGDLLVAAEGYIREVNTATADELGVMRGEIIDSTTTTAVDVVL